MFQVQTYAAPTDYVPEWLDNRKAWKAGKDFFYCKLAPVNDSEFHILHKGALEAEKDGGLYIDFLRKRVVEIVNLQLVSNDGTVIHIRNGSDLIDIGRKYLDASQFAGLTGELTSALMKQSVLSEGELKVSNSSPASLVLETARS